MALINQYEIEKFIAATAARADIKVVWGDTTPCVKSDGRNTTMYLPRITDKTTKEQAESLMAGVVHEVAHIEHSDFDVYNKYGADAGKSFLGAIANAIEDDGVDYLNSREFAGDRMIRTKVVNRHLDRIANEMKAAKRKGMPQIEVDKIGSLIKGMTETAEDYFSGTTVHQEALSASLSKDGEKFYEEFMKNGIPDKIRAIRDLPKSKRSEAAYQLAKQVFKTVYKLDPEEEEKQNMARAKAEAEGKGEPQDGEGDGEAVYGVGKDGKPRTKHVTVDYRPFMEDQHDEFKKGGGMKGEGMTINYKDEDITSGRGTYAPTPLDKTIVVDYVAKKSNYGGISPNADEADSSSVASLMRRCASDAFANKVRMLLQIRSRATYQYGTKSGNLHPSNLYRVVLKDAPGYNERVFKKRIVKDTLNTAVTVLVDISGSMSGSKFANAAQAAVQLSHTVGNTLHIPVEIVGFTEHECRNAMFIYRKHDTKLLSSEELAKRMYSSAKHMNQNCDGDSVMWGYNRLVHRKEKRKVLIVLSDGQPASSKGGNIAGYTHDVAKEIEKGRHVELVGIGIMDSTVKKFYKDHAIITSANEIEHALLSVIDRKLI